MINEREELVKKYLENKGHKVKRIETLGYPDFLIDDKFYVEVKNADVNMEKISTLSSYQEKTFKLLNLPIKIYKVINKRKILIEDYKSNKKRIDKKQEELKPKHRQIIDFIKRRKKEWVSTTAIAMGTFKDHYAIIKNLGELEAKGILKSQQSLNKFTYWKLIK